MSAIHYQFINPFADKPAVKKVWCELLQHSEHSFFQAWAWVDTWLATIPDNRELHCVVGYDEQLPVFATFIAKVAQTRSGFVRATTIHINELGDEYFDDLVVEYNRCLVREGYDIDMSEVLPLIEPWDECIASAFSDSAYQQFIQSLKNYKASQCLTLQTSPSYYVDLDKVRSADSYLSLLSRNRREKIRRSIKAYQTYGDVVIQPAKHTDDALAMLNELAVLHQATWQQRGKAGSFSSEFFTKFHHRLIKNYFDDGVIQLLNVQAGEYTLGYIYNFVYQGKVYFYQCGFNYDAQNNKLRPGVVSHCYAIDYNARLGHTQYDFLGGDKAYKKSLATDENTLHWIKIQKPKLRFMIEKQLKQLKAKLRR